MTLQQGEAAMMSDWNETLVEQKVTYTLEVNGKFYLIENVPARVNPETGERDITLFSLIQKHFKHKQTGVLAKVITNGTVTLGDSLTIVTEESEVGTSG